MMLKGSEIVLECLLEHDVHTVFGYPGSAILDIYEALHTYAPRIRHILTTHEQHAAHAADGFARASGGVGVVFATSGPGATNLLTGLSSAYIDSVPVVAITCNVQKSLIGKDSFQEVDIYGVSMPITKHNFLVKDVAMLADTIRHAFYIATSDRPGPVLIDIPSDVIAATCAYEKKTPPKPRKRLHANDADYAAAAALIAQSRRPFILAGGGVAASKAKDALSLFSQKIDAPIAETLMGVGCAESTERFAGLAGIYGEKQTNTLFKECDLLIGIGTRFSDRTVPDPNHFVSGAQIIHIDIDPAEINKNVQAQLSLIGDARVILTRLTEIVRAKTGNPLFSLLPAREEPAATGPASTPRILLETLSRLAGKEQIYTTEVGQHQLWAAKYLGIHSPEKFITSGGLGAMGFGLGAALGVAAATGKRIVNIAGDGSFYMNMAELSTAVYYKLPVVEILFNNTTLGLVHQIQGDVYGRSSEVGIDRGTDFAALAAAMGAASFAIKDPSEIEPVLQKALSCGKAVLVDCKIPPECRVERGF